MIITVIRKPFEGALVDNIRESQCGGLSIDSCRISNEGDPTDKRGTTRSRKQVGFWSDAINEGSTGNGFNGRWPANFILNHKEGCKHVGTKRVKTNHQSNISFGSGRGVTYQGGNP